MKKYITISLGLFVSVFYSCKTVDSPDSDDGLNVMAYYYPSRGDFHP